MAGLHGHRDVETQLMMNASDSSQQQVLHAGLTGAVHPDQPRPRPPRMPAQVDHSPGRAPESFDRQALRQRRVVLECQSLVGQAGDASTLDRLDLQRLWVRVRAISTQC